MLTRVDEPKLVISPTARLLTDREVGDEFLRLFVKERGGPFKKRIEPFSYERNSHIRLKVIDKTIAPLDFSMLLTEFSAKFIAPAARELADLSAPYERCAFVESPGGLDRLWVSVDTATQTATRFMHGFDVRDNLFHSYFECFVR